MVLRLHQRAGVVLLSLAAPRRLAHLMLRPHPQPMSGSLESTGHVERVEFEVRNGLHCRGWWVTPRDCHAHGDRVVVLAHGWTSNALRMHPFLEPLLDLGFQVMLYSARNHGDSDPFPFISLAQFTEDLTAATRFAGSRAGRVTVLGHSLGAAATLVAAADGAPIDAAVVLAPPASPQLGFAELLQSQRLPAELIVRRIAPHVEELIGRSFASITVAERIREVRCPVLLLHGTADEVVSLAHCERIRAAAGPNVEICLVDGADHDAVSTGTRVQGRITEFLERVMAEPRLDAQ